MSMRNPARHPGALPALARVARECLPMVVVTALAAGCEEPFEPFQESPDGAFSMFGYLNVKADTQWVRVMPVRQNLFLQPEPIDAVVTLEHLGTGRVVTLRDSLFSFPDPVLGVTGPLRVSYHLAEPAGALVSAYLLSVMLGGLRSVCWWCTLTHLINFVLLFLAWKLFRPREGEEGWPPLRLALAGVLLMIAWAVLSANFVEGAGIVALDGQPVSPHSAERVILPDATILLDYMLVRMTGLVEGLAVALELRRPWLALYLTGWNPLLLFHLVANGHNDGLLALLLLLALRVLIGGSEQKAWLSGPVLAMSVLVKYASVLAAPFMFVWFAKTRQYRQLALGILAGVAVVALFAGQAIGGRIWAVGVTVGVVSVCVALVSTPPCSVPPLSRTRTATRAAPLAANAKV